MVPSLEILFCHSSLFFFFFFVFSELLLPTNTHSEGAEVAFLDHLTAGDTGQQVRRWSLSFFKSTERGGKEGKKTKVLTTTATEKRGKTKGNILLQLTLFTTFFAA